MYIHVHTNVPVCGGHTVKIHFKRKRGESDRWCQSSAGCERVQAMAGEKRETLLGETDRERKPCGSVLLKACRHIPFDLRPISDHKSERKGTQSHALFTPLT